jgi:hypothetical protein
MRFGRRLLRKPEREGPLPRLEALESNHGRLDHLQTGMLFRITTEWCSPSDRNRVHLRPDSPFVSRDCACLFDLPVAYSGCELELGRMSESDDYAKRAQEPEIENRRLKTALSDLEKSYDITLEALGDALDLKDAAIEGRNIVLPVLG